MCWETLDVVAVHAVVLVSHGLQAIPSIEFSAFQDAADELQPHVASG